MPNVPNRYHNSGKPVKVRLKPQAKRSRIVARKALLKKLKAANAGRSHFVTYKSRMIQFTETNIIIAVIGMVGLLSSGVVITTAFKRNRTHRY